MKIPAFLSVYCRHTAFTLALAALLTSQAAQAATKTWNLATGGDFNTTANWTGGLPVATDLALFNIVTGDVSLSAAATPGSINFDTNASTFALGALAGSTITTAHNGNLAVMVGLVGANKSFTLNAPLVLTPETTTKAGSYSILNNATDASNVLVIAGGITTSTTSSTETLTLSGTNTGANTISGITLGGATTFVVTKLGTGSWTLAGANSYNGGTTVSAGTLNLIGAISGGTSITVSGAAVFAESAAGAIAGASAFTHSSTATSTLAGYNSNSGNTTLNAGTLNLTGALSGTAITAYFGSTFSESTTGELAGGTSLTVNSATATLAGANSASGGTAVNSGILNLDYSTQDNSKLADAGTLTLAGGTLNLVGGSHQEVVGSTTLNAGAAVIARPSGTVSLRLNAITRNAGGTLNLDPAIAVDTDTVNLGGLGILGGYATFNATAGAADWAKSINASAADTSISAFTSYDAFATSGTSSNNPLLTGAATLTGNLTANSLKIASSGASQALDLGTGQTLTLATGGLLFTGANDYQINNGTLKSATASNSDLIIQHWGAGSLTINSVIANGTGTSTLTKAGPGTLILSGANSYTGATYLNEGMLRFGSGSMLATTALTVNGTLDLNNSNQTVDGLSGKTSGLILNNGSGLATLTIGQLNGGGTFTGVIADNNNAGTGIFALTKNGTNTQTFTGVNTYTGATTINGGNVYVSGPAGTMANSSGYVVTGAGLHVGDSYVALAGRLNASAGITLGGGNGGGTFKTTKPNGATQNVDVASLTIAAGQSNMDYNNGNGGYLNAGAYARNPGGVFSSNGGGGATCLGFSAAPTGSSVIGANASAMLIGGVVTGSNFNFVKAAAGTNTNPATANDSYASGTNTLVTAAATPISATTTTQSIQWSGGLTQTLTVNSDLTVESGGIALGNGSTTIGVGTIAGTGTIKAANGRDLWIGVQAGTSTISASIADDGSSSGLTKFMGGALLLSGNNTFSGPIYLDQGTLAIGHANALGTGTANLNFLGGASGATVTLKASGVDFTTARTVVLAGGPNASVIDTNGQNVSLAGVISSTGTASTATIAMSKIGTGTLTLSGANTFNGNTTVTGGTLNLSNGTALANSTFIGGGGTLAFDSSVASHAFTFGGLNGSSNLALTDTAATAVALTIGGNNNSYTYSGILSGAGSLTKLGTGTQTLTGLNTFGGGLTVKAGTVLNTAISIQPVGTGTITLGDSSNTGAAAMLNLNSLATLTYTNALATAGTGLSTLNLANYSATFTGGLAMGGNLLLSTTNPNNSVLALSGAISGSGNLTLQVGGANTGSGITLSGATINPAGTITNSGTGVAASSISGAIGASVTGVIQNSATSALNLTGTNSFSGGITIKAGTVNVSNKALGYDLTHNVGAITVGDVANTGLAATLNVNNNGIGNSGAGNNPINVVGTGTRTISATNYYPVFTGAVTLNSTDLRIVSTNTGGSDMTFSGGFSGAGNLVIQSNGINNANANSRITLNGITVNHSGSITNSGTGTASGTGTVNTTISAAIGSNVTHVTQNSATSALNLSGTVAYSGNTTVSAGTLKIAKVNANNETSTVTIAATGATLQLDFSGTDTVAQLIIGAGAPLAPGIYGGPLSGASVPNQLAQMSGTGTLTVAAAANYASWAGSHGITGQPASGDYDNDGLTNLTEYALGLVPTVASPPAGTMSGTVLTFLKGSDAIANHDVNFVIEDSTDLVNWTPAVTQNAPNAATTISYDLATGGNTKHFARLKTVQVP